MDKQWQERLKAEMDADCLKWDETALTKFSKDYHHFSPVLSRELKDKVAECIVSPRNEDELDLAISILVEEQVPITVRGNGTGNYGQAVPLTGGAVLNLANMSKVLEIGDGYMVCEPGARLSKMDEAARSNDQEILMMPSTFQQATIGGFLNGGFGGIGSITWGTIWDGFVQSMKIKTITSPPTTIEVTGADMLPYLHTYGTIGILSEVQVKLAPKVEWMQWAMTFEKWESAVKFGLELAADESIAKRLLSVHEWPIPSYFSALKLPAGRAAVLLEIDEQAEGEIERLLTCHDGRVDLKVPAEKYRKGLGVSDFTWNHTTLWARKNNTGLTYLQTTFDWDRLFEQMDTIRNEYPELFNHLEFYKQNGKLRIAGLPILEFQSDERLNGLIASYEEIGVSVSNPHTWDLKDGGRSYSIENLWALKRSNDPVNILNQLKLGKLPSANGA